MTPRVAEHSEDLGAAESADSAGFIRISRGNIGDGRKRYAAPDVLCHARQARGHTAGHLRTQAGTYYSSAHEKPAHTRLRRSGTRIIQFLLRVHALRTRSTRGKHDERTSKRPFKQQDEEAAKLPTLGYDRTREKGTYTHQRGHPAAQILIQQGRQHESAPPAHLNQVAEALRAPERRLLRLFHKKTRFRASTAAEFLQEQSQRRAPRRRDLPRPYAAGRPAAAG
ncbi:hypothetical protein DFH06DRAFT_1143132 [Mycena polygramma]|nr:hypothetical protein DFH06DRAFT_1143132 [Mycena polygramma]